MDFFSRQYQILEHITPLRLLGKVVGVTGLVVKVAEFPVPIGSQCRIYRRLGNPLEAEVIGFAGKDAILMPYDELIGIAPGDKVECITTHQHIPVGNQLLGRIVDGFVRPIDGNEKPLLTDDHYPLINSAPHAVKRRRISSPLGTGIRAVDTLITTGKGQRMGIFAGPGVGKSVLLGMIARYTSADVTVIALVGERGREVREFIERDLGQEGIKRSVVVVSTSDQSPVLRIRATLAATTIAEYFRDQGMDVLLLVDSITRLAMAQRQIGLAAGEPPATKGYTPSVFSLLPKLLERAGQSESGSITGFYSVLVEGDDITEPISDITRSILDGHLWLSRDLANRGHYPAISVLDSISRTMPEITSTEHLEAAKKIRRLLAVYRDMEDMINIGAYVPGSNPEVDLVIKVRPAMEKFLQQGIDEFVDFETARRNLFELVDYIERESRNIRSNERSVA